MEGKFEANANKYMFVWRKSVRKHQKRLEQKLTGVISELCMQYGWKDAEKLKDNRFKANKF